MNSNNKFTEENLQELTKKAVEKVKTLPPLEKSSETMSPEAYQQVLHELRVHQIELEMQNEELHQSQLKLDSLRARYFDLYDMAPVGYCTISEQGKIVEANLTATVMLGLDRSALINSPISKFIYKEDQDIYYLYSKQLNKTGKSQSCELRMLRNDGEQLWIRLEGLVMQVEQDTKSEVRLIMSDISDKMILNEMNLSLEGELQDIYLALNTSSIIAFTDREGNITYANDKFCEISQYSREELVGQNHRILKSGFHTDQFYKDLWRTISSGNVWTGEIKNRAKDGTYYWVMTTIIPFMDENKQPNQYFSIRMDITKNKEIEKELFQSQINEQVTIQLMEEKRKFIDTATHELRNPITYLSLLLQGAKKHIERGQPITNDIISKLRKPVDRLARLVSDLLDTSRQERGLMIILPVKTDIGFLISECLEEFKVQAPNRQIQFIRPDELIEINIDPLKITQVLTNLLDNALKYSSEEGAIEVAIVDKANTIRVSVSDHGAGISKDQQKVLFSAFSRGNTEATARAAGLGLGLSICKGIVDLHKGHIGVESIEGKGSTFYFELPKNNKKLC